MDYDTSLDGYETDVIVLKENRRGEKQVNLELLLWETAVNMIMVVKLEGQTSSKKINDVLEIHL